MALAHRCKIAALWRILERRLRRVRLQIFLISDRSPVECTLCEKRWVDQNEARIGLPPRPRQSESRIWTNFVTKIPGPSY